MRIAQRSISLNRMVLIITVLFLSLTILGIFVTSAYIKEEAINDLARDDAYKTSQLVFQSLYSAMRKGWNKTEITEITERLNQIEPGMTIRVLRGEPVIRQFGAISGEKAILDADPVLQRALHEGRDFLNRWSEETIRYVYPLTVKAECLGCHSEAHAGEINGAIDIIYPIKGIKVSLDFVMNMVIVYLTVVMVLLILALQSSLRSLIVRPIARITGVMRGVISHLDLTQRVTAGTHITEILSLTTYFNKLLSAMQGYSNKLEQLGARDPLTGLYNRRKFNEFVEHEVDRCYRYDEPFSLLLLDLDNFKHVNDTFGHPIGDLVLKKFTTLVQEQLRKTDIFARFGGDEYGILLTETPRAKAQEVAEKLRQRVADKDFDLPTGKIRITTSIGLITFPQDVAKLEKLMSAVDIAMYKAKHAGRNQVMTIDGSEMDTTAEIFVRGQLVRRALEEDRVDAFWQPIVDVATGNVFAYEVLARIRDGDAIINAEEFIHVAEELGMAEEIDMRVFDKSLRYKAGKDMEGIKLFFNLSSKTFCNAERMRHIPARLALLEANPADVVFEITEREALPHIGELSTLIHDLREHGITFALDDFGSGFSSFLYLKFLKVDYVKIEGTFVRQMASDGRDRILVEEIHSIATKFGIQTIAEHVESPDIHHLLQGMEIQFGQGYHYGHAVPLE